MTKNMKHEARSVIAGLIFVSCFLFPASSLAAACPAAGCGASQYCARDTRIPEGSACYPTCDPDAPATASTCTGGTRCVSVTGQGVCVAPDSPLLTGGAVTNPPCDAGRSCPTDRRYECVSDVCRIPNGQACTETSQCMEGSTCAGAGTGGTVCNPTPPGSSASTEPTERPFSSITPNLGVTIPGTELTPAERVGDEVEVPFLAQYINGAYRYGVTIVLVISIVMVVYGGFRYLVGASIGDIQAGKKIIQDALIGMLLVLGAYMLLNTINPDTLNFKALHLVFVNRIDIESALLATTVDTLDQGSDAGPPSAGSATPVYTDCPVELSTPADEPPGSNEDRTQEFKTDIAALVTGGSSRERVIRMAEAAAKCGVRFNSCGRTAEEIYVTAGSSGRGHQTHTVPGPIINYLDEHNCAEYSRECNTPAIAAAYELIQSQIPGWPDEWANELQAGDVITVFNANSGLAGLHRAIFMGWAGAGRAQVVQGAWTRFVSEGTICITSDCSNPRPLIRTFEPRP